MKEQINEVISLQSHVAQLQVAALQQQKLNKMFLWGDVNENIDSTTKRSH